MVTNALGIYEKALPRGLSWEQTFDLVHELGYNFLEFSVDESDERLARLDWTEHDRARFRDAMWHTHSRINTMMLSGHQAVSARVKRPRGAREGARHDAQGDRPRRRSGHPQHPARRIRRVLRAENPAVSRILRREPAQMRRHGREETGDALHRDDGRPVHQLAGQGHLLQVASAQSMAAGVPGCGQPHGLAHQRCGREIESNIDNIVAVHLKDTKPVGETSKGVFKRVPFGEGAVDFEACLRIFKRLGYQGSYTVEMWTDESPDPVAEVTRAKKMFDGLFDVVASNRSRSPASENTEPARGCRRAGTAFDERLDI